MRLRVFPHLEQKSANLCCLLRLAIERFCAIKESCNQRLSLLFVGSCFYRPQTIVFQREYGVVGRRG